MRDIRKAYKNISIFINYYKISITLLCFMFLVPIFLINISSFAYSDQEQYLLTKSGGSYGTGDGQFDALAGVAIDSLGFVYVVDAGNNRVQKFDSDGNFITKWGSHGTGPGEFENPVAIDIDSLNRIYVTNNNRV